MPKLYLKTYGCQMNEHDSRKIGVLLGGHGFEATDRLDDADLILFNTCTIREKAEHKALSEIGRTAKIKARRPDVLVGVCGCVAQQEKETLFEKFPHVDLLFGPDQIPNLPHLLQRVAAERTQVAALDLINTPDEYEFLSLVPWRATTTTAAASPCAFVTIMKGCDANCAYCIVPKVRGVEVCRPADDIVAEVAQLAARGVREVTLLGQTVNTYGNRRHGGVMPFAQLLRRIADETDIARIRFTSPHPKDLNDELTAEYRDNPKLCPHMHLPVQSGSDATLRRMRRSYSRAHYLDKVAVLRAAVPDIAISTDMIVGFPGETDADFAETLSLIETVRFSGIYAFKYSPRPGTESFSAMCDDVPDDVKRVRLEQLFATNQRVVGAYMHTQVGQRTTVLIDGHSKRDGYWMGRSPQNIVVNCQGDGAVGCIVDVEIVRAGNYALDGRITTATRDSIPPDPSRRALLPTMRAATPAA